jgi:DNA-binding MarR family transcriptional regulator
MITNDDDQLSELSRLLRRVMRGLWARRRPTQELLELVSGDPPLGRRHVRLLAQIGTDGERSVGELARELDLSLPAASKLTRDLEDHGLVERREDPEDRRRTVVALSPRTAKRVNVWLERRSKPLEQALATLDPKEREAFLKGLRALGDALMEESACGPKRHHDRKAHRRGAHRDRPV